MLNKLSWITVVIGCLVVLPAHAQVYKWVDANGKTQYSDSPPAGAAKAAVVKGAPAAADKPAQTDWQEKDREFRSRKIKQEDATRKEEEETQKLAQEKSKACLSAREQIDDLGRGVPLYKVNAKGERVYMEDAERPGLLKAARQSVTDNCPH